MHFVAAEADGDGDAGGEFAGTIAYGESADTAIAKLKRLAAGAQS